MVQKSKVVLSSFYGNAAPGTPFEVDSEEADRLASLGVVVEREDLADFSPAKGGKPAKGDKPGEGGQ